MLKTLFIKNIGLIEEQQIDFSDGLNILTGETGSGKSMIINAINFLSGKRIDKLNIRKNCKDALIEGVFLLHEKNFAENFGIEISEDNLLIISRKYVSGRITTRINGRIVTVGMLRQISSYLLEFHGQNENQKILDSKYQLEVLDKFCFDEVTAIKKDLKNKLKEMLYKQKTVENLVGQNDFDDKIMMLEFQIKELTDANLIFDEEKNLKIKYKKINNAKSLYEKMSQVIKLIYDNQNYSVSDMVSHACKILEQVKNDDPSQKNIFDMIKSIEINLNETKNDFYNVLLNYSEILEDNSDKINQIENRLDFLYNLKIKYKKNPNELIDYLEILIDKHKNLLNSREIINNLNIEMQNLKKQIICLCEKLTDIRVRESKKICLELQKTLSQLGILNSKLEIKFKKKLNFDCNGQDEIEFFISTNIGEDLKPLAKFISGGEISRIMLAIKSIFVQFDNNSTLVFDEIDTGIGGKTAHCVAEKLKKISYDSPIICITHLAQIAAVADQHFLVQKYFDADITKIKISLLDKNQRLNELARMLSGKDITENILKTARELLF